MIWNETKECMSRDEMTNLQGARLSKLVDRVYHNVEYYSCLLYTSDAADE